MTFRKRILAASLISIFISVDVFATPPIVNFDFDGDGRGDLALFDAARGTLTIRKTSNRAFRTIQVGTGGNVPAVGDFNQDNVADVAVFNRSTGYWRIHLSGGREVSMRFGKAGSYPVPANYRGDSCTDLAVYSPSTSTWKLGDCLTSGSEVLRFGKPGDIPVPCDYDGDGKDDVAVFRPNQTPGWRILRSSNLSVRSVDYGLPGDIPVPGHYTRTDLCELAVYRPSNNTLYVRKSGSETLTFQWGLNGDHFFPVDYDGDGKIDRVVYRPSNNSFYIQTADDQTESRIAWTDALPSGDALASHGFPLTPARYLFTHTEGDYNGDGRTDLVSVDLQSGTYGNWSVINLSDLTTIHALFGLAGDTPRGGDTDGDGVFEPIVFRGGTSQATWYLRRSDTRALAVDLGLSGDTPILGDFDCDGKDDLAVVRTVEGNRYWYIRESKNNDVVGVQYGTADDQIFAADTDGDHCDEMVLARSDASTQQVSWYSRSLDTRIVQRVNWGLVGDELVPPIDYNGDGRDDFIVTRTINNQKTALIRMNSFTDEQVAIDSGDTMPGMYAGLIRSELATFSGNGSNGSLVIHNHTGSQSEVTLTYASTETVMLPAGMPIAASPTGGGSSSGLSAQCSNIVGVYHGFLWKPSSDDSGPPRQGKPAALFKTNTPHASCLNIYDSNGNVVSKLGLYQLGGTYGGRWYVGWGCGDRKTGSAIAAEAQANTGSSDVYIERSGGTCVGPLNPASRNGSL